MTRVDPTKAPPLLRPDLPPLPPSLQHRPIDYRGFPVPYFLVDQDAAAIARGYRWDFRLVASLRVHNAQRRRVCWICGEKLTGHRSFIVGPMCAVNRTTIEPPSHMACALFAVQACPFLANALATRRQFTGDEGRDLCTPDGMIAHNPGVVVIWTVANRFGFATSPAGSDPTKSGLWFHLGQPVHLGAWSNRALAGSLQLAEALRRGLPHLRALGLKQGVSDATLAQMIMQFIVTLSRVAPHLRSSDLDRILVDWPGSFELPDAATARP